MSQIWWRSIFGHEPEEVDENHPFPVQVREDPYALGGLPPVAGRTVWRQVMVPGIGTGAAYADKETFGTLMEFPNMVRPERRTGLLHTALYYDLDDEGLQVDLHLFRRNVASAVTSADNAALVITDAGLLDWIGTLQFTSFYDLNTGQVSQVTSAGIAFGLVGTSIYAQAQARSAVNIAAGHLPRFTLGVLVD